ncbi:MAG: glycosyltransferase family 39 protein [bacterium]|nr:glycosyltransferase family 39 protein [bacterium]
MFIEKNKWLFLILALYFILAINYTINVPIFEAPDEPDHFLHVKYLIKYHRLPLLDEKIPDAPRTAIHPPLYYFLSAIIYAPFQAYDHAIEYTYNEKFGLINKNRYFHKDENLRDHFPFYIVRLFSILLGMGTIVFGWKTANELFEEKNTLTIMSTMLIAFIPQFIYISSVLNCDNLANFVSSVILWLLIKMAKDDHPDKKDIIVTGIFLGLAAITKFTVLFVIPFAILVLYIIQENKIEYLKNVLIILIIIVIISGWYYLRNYLISDYALGGKFVLKRGLLSSYFIKPFAVMMLLSFFGLFGWMNIVMGKIIYMFYIIFYGIGFFTAMNYIIKKKPPIADKYPKIRIYTCIMFLGILLSLISNIRYNMYGDDYQGRHMHTVIVPFAILTAMGYYYIYSLIKEKYQLLIGEKAKTLIIFILIIIFVYLNIFIVNAYIKPGFAGAFI